MTDVVIGLLLAAAAGLFVAGGVALFRPLPKLGLRTRSRALMAIGAAVVCVVLTGPLLPEPEKGPAQTPEKASAPSRPLPAPAPLPPVKPASEDLAAGVGEATPGVVHLSRIGNDDGVTTDLWAQSRIGGGTDASRLDETASALRSVYAYCGGGAAQCRGIRDLWLWSLGDVESHGTVSTDKLIGVRLRGADFSTPPASNAEALDRVEPLPATPNGRAILSAWCEDHRREAPKFCAEVDELVRPRR